MPSTGRNILHDIAEQSIAGCFEVVLVYYCYQYVVFSSPVNGCIIKYYKQQLFADKFISQANILVLLCISFAFRVSNNIKISLDLSYS